jgi:hypothetical protein
MEMIDMELIDKVQKALNLKLYDWQIDYILEKPRVLDMRITGRRTGKTLAYIIKLLFTDSKPIRAYDFKEIEDYSDWYCITNRADRKEPHYTHWFRRYLKDIYTELKINGLKPRQVFFSREEERQFNSQ